MSLDYVSSTAAPWLRLQESGEYQEMDMGTEVVGLGLDDGDELEYMEITDLAIADDLATCS